MNARIAARVHSFIFAATVVVVAVALRLAADPWLGRSVPYLLFYPAIMIAATYGGFWPGVAATILSALVALFAYLGPSHRFGALDTAEAVGLALFVANGTLISQLSDMARRGRASEQRLAAIVASSEDAIVGKDLEGKITSWNEGAARVFGFPADEAVGQPITIILPPERLAEERQVLEKIRAGQRVEPFETVRRRKDGTDIGVSVTISPIRNAQGVVVGASKIARDITERQRQERVREELTVKERLAREEAVAVRDRLAFLAEVGAVLSSSLDYSETLDRAVHYALPRLGDFCNVLIEDEQGRLGHAAWGHVDRRKEPLLRSLVLGLLEMEDPATLAYARTVMKTGQSLTVPNEVLATAARNETRIPPEVAALAPQLMPYAYVGVPLRVRGRVVGVMSFGTTEQESRREYTPNDVLLVEEFARRVSIAVENARLFRQADELNRLKDEFLATVSHELRTPLSAVLGWSRMLAGGQLTPEQTTQALKAIERNARAQAKLVDDILDVARGIAGNVRLDIRPVDLTRVAYQAVEAIAPTAGAKKIDVDMKARQAVRVIGDPGRLRQVVWNLLSNAVKFTPSEGRVTLDVVRVEGNAELLVTDTGIGIPPAFLPYVFDKFRQADGSYTRQHGGLGLGLAIARHLIELHGGSIEARSAGEGSGATFVVRLPLASPGEGLSSGGEAMSAAARGMSDDVPEHDH